MTTPAYENAKLLIARGISVAPSTTSEKFLGASTRVLTDLASKNGSPYANFRIQAGNDFGLAILEIRDSAFKAIAHTLPPLPNTWRVARRPGHSYWLFRCSESISMLKRPRCNGTIMVRRSAWVAGSKNKKGQVYNWVPGCDPSIPLAELPKGWIAILKKRERVD